MKKDSGQFDGLGENTDPLPTGDSRNLLARLRRVRTFTSLGIPAYRLYWAAVLCQMAAMNMQMISRSWFMYELTGRAAMLGAVALGSALPMLSYSMFQIPFLLYCITLISQLYLDQRY